MVLSESGRACPSVSDWGQNSQRMIEDNAVSPSVDYLISIGRYPDAIARLRLATTCQENQNRLGVCLMRISNVEEAVKIYRQLVLAPGCTWLRPELPASYKRNFATALLLAGLPSGALDVLHQSGDPYAVYYVRLRAAIQLWARTLPFMQRIDWYINLIEPRNPVIMIDFEPGELEYEVELTRPCRTVTTGSPRLAV